jgi:hypothetical protein
MKGGGVACSPIPALAYTLWTSTHHTDMLYLQTLNLEEKYLTGQNDGWSGMLPSPSERNLALQPINRRQIAYTMHQSSAYADAQT